MAKLGARLIISVIAVAMTSLIANDAQAICKKSVTVYSAYWCGNCAAVRALLSRYHVPFKKIETGPVVNYCTDKPILASMYRRWGDCNVPKTVIGGVLVRGYDPARIKQLRCLG